MTPQERLSSEMLRFAVRLCERLQEQGCQARMETPAGLFVTRNGVRLRAQVILRTSLDPERRKNLDLTEFKVLLVAKRVFDVHSTDIVLDVPALAETLKGGKSEELVATQLLEQLESAPLGTYCAELLARMA